ncbi:hypothetical protein ABIB99_001902 [Bradyrhizobium sp. LA6.1]|uniref:hypothetical protein n=1 Tax=Bradyrhizobium sp. LA6.1 TaxID=3156378 RepID=UPI003396FA14
MTDQPTRQAIAVKERSGKLTVSGKLARAIEFMVWEGARRQDAAEKAGLKDHSLRAALRKPHVLQHYNAELGVLRESVRAKNFHRLDEIADGPNAMARVQAIRTMEGQAEEQRNAPASTVRPGLVIVINAKATPTDAPATIDVTPNLSGSNHGSSGEGVE